MVHASSHAGYRMPFGCHKGWLLADLPDAYFDWLLGIELRQPLLAHVLDEADRRSRERRATRRPQTYPPPADIAAIITRWHRELAVRWHPDKGGDPRIMAALNDAADRLRELLEVA